MEGLEKVIPKRLINDDPWGVHLYWGCTCIGNGGAHLSGADSYEDLAIQLSQCHFRKLKFSSVWANGVSLQC